MQLNRTNTTIVSISALAIAMSAGLLVAGPLTPPPGALASTYKTLNEVEPRTPLNATNTPGSAIAMYTIMQPGAYYLTGDVAVAAGKAAIAVQVPDVTIDLNGFRIAGGAKGITMGVGSGRVVVKNGHISGSSERAIDAETCANCRYEGLTVALGNAEGIFAGPGSMVERCNVKLGAQPGIKMADGTVRQCTVDAAGGYGIWMYSFGTVTECTVTGTATEGIRMGSGGVLRSCVVSGASIGISTTGTVIEGCTVNQNQQGIYAFGSIVRDCVARDNSAQGFRIGTGCTVTGCRAIDNGTAGSYANIWVSGSGSRLEDNSCIQTEANTDYGFWVDGIDNILVRNTARNHTNDNFHILNANNEIAPVVNNPGSNAFSTMMPWSNVSH